MSPLLALVLLLVVAGLAVLLVVLRRGEKKEAAEVPSAHAEISQNLARIAAPVTGPVKADEFPHMSLAEHAPAPTPVVPATALAAQAVDGDDGEPLFTIQVWQLGVLVFGLLAVFAHFVAGTPLPQPSGFATFKLVLKLGGALLLLLLLVALRKRQSA